MTGGLGEIDSLALPYENYELALKAGFPGWSVPEGSGEDIALLKGGYVDIDGDLWVPSGRVFYDPARFYLPYLAIDPFGNASQVEWDSYDLLVRSTTDACGNTTVVENDYRVLAPSHLKDANENGIAFSFDALGMLTHTALEGKGEGDTLADPTTELQYDLHRFYTERKPVVVRTAARERHADASSPWQIAYSYSDGHGQEVMKKVQAEPGDAPARGADGELLRDATGALVLQHTNTRWAGTGRTVFDNKANPIKQYEPFFSSTFEYEDEDDLVEWGLPLSSGTILWVGS